MKKKIFSILLGIIIMGSLSGCGNKSAPNENGVSNENIKGKCVAVECIKKIEPKNTVDEINNIIGLSGELIDEKYNIYYWKISENTGLKVAYYSGDDGTISIDYNRDDLTNSKVDFSRYDELQSKIKEGILYNDFISYIGNVQGTIIEKSSTSIKYTWVSKDGSYLNGSFLNSSGKCTFAIGRIK